jgi:hypothetical protein
MGGGAMNMTQMGVIAKDKDKTWYLNLTGAAKFLGCGRHLAAQFLAEKNVPYYRVGKSKKYFLPHVIEAVEKTKWRDAPPKTKPANKSQAPKWEKKQVNKGG